MPQAPHPDTWIRITPQGLYCEPGDFHIDPVTAVPRAIISHGHSDHARPGHDAVLATPETLAIMTARLGAGNAGRTQQPLGYHQPVVQNDVRITLVPAGHVLGSAQVVLDWQGSRIVVSGDYKRQPDPTCAPFEPVTCDVFVTEATFALPVFRHPPVEHEIQRLLDSVALFPERSHLVGCYALGKCQRLIALLRQAGWDRPIYLHGAQINMCALYERFGVGLGDLRPVPKPEKRGATVLAGEIVLAPPSAEANPWMRRLADPVTAVASGWMRVRQRAKARGVELPLIVSDHADWPDLLASIAETAAPEVWVTHGREEALIHALGTQGIRGRALHLLGREEDEGETAADATEAVGAGAETDALASGAPASDAPVSGEMEPGAKEPGT